MTSLTPTTKARPGPAARSASLLKNWQADLQRGLDRLEPMVGDVQALQISRARADRRALELETVERLASTEPGRALASTGKARGEAHIGAVEQLGKRAD